MYKIGNISMDKYKTSPMILIFKTDLIIHIFSNPVTSHTLDPSKHVRIGITGKCYKKLAEPAEINMVHWYIYLEICLIKKIISPGYFMIDEDISLTIKSKAAHLRKETNKQR